MANIGQRNNLRVVREAPPGFYLDGGPAGEILLPGRYIPPGTAPGDRLDVFVYRDSEDRLVATTETPHAAVGEFAYMRVISVNPRVGAFLDWGLAKDLLLPFREQAHPVREDEWVVACVCLDPHTNRIVATTRLARHFHHEPPPYAPGEAVNLLVTGPTPLGFSAIVENAHRGLLYHDRLTAPLTPGQKIKGYVRAIRPNGQIDLSLDPGGYQRVAPLSLQIVQALEKHGGRLDFDDDTPPETIRATFGVSKKAFKQALGQLYKHRRIRFLRPGIELLDNTDWTPGA